MQSKLNLGRDLKSQMTVKSKTDKAVTTTAAEMKTTLDELGAFVENCSDGMAQADAFNESTPKDQLNKEKSKIEALLRLADTHKTGFQTAKKRWDALLGK